MAAAAIARRSAELAFLRQCRPRTMARQMRLPCGGGERAVMIYHPPMDNVKYHAVIETNSNGEVAIAIAHMSNNGPVVDAIEVMTVTGGEAGIDAVYRGLCEQGIEVTDCRIRGQNRVGDVRARAIAAVLKKVKPH